jgi:hypothetical protein
MANLSLVDVLQLAAGTVFIIAGIGSTMLAARRMGARPWHLFAVLVVTIAVALVISTRSHTLRQ